MCNNGLNFGCGNIWWIIILLLLFGNGGRCGDSCGCGGCGCNGTGYTGGYGCGCN